MSHPGKIRSLLATARIANVPSVVSNVWVGLYLGREFVREQSASTFWLLSALIAVSGVCLYLAGNFLNDWYDREWDVERRPERALPRGLFHPTAYLTTSIVLALTGLVVSALVSWIALAVAMTILLFVCIYTAVHKRAAWSVVPMGLCRAFLIFLGVAAVGFPAISQLPAYELRLLISATAAFSACLFLHIAGLSMSARKESANPTGGGLFIRWPFLVVPIPALVFIISFAGKDWIDPLLYSGIAVYLFWIVICHTILRKTVSSYVSGLLAGIPLVDCFALLPSALLALTSPDYASDNPLIWIALLLPPAAFILALILQRVAPAT